MPLLCLLLLPPVAGADNDDWSLGDDQAFPATSPVVAGLLLGTDPQDSQTLSAWLLLPLTPDTELDLDYARTRIDDGDDAFDSNDLGGRLSYWIGDRLGLYAGYRFQGQRDALEIERLRIGISRLSARGRIDLSLSQGDIAIYTRGDLPPPLHLPSRFTSDSNSIALELAHRFGAGEGMLSVERFDYDRDLSPLHARPLLQRIISANALQQSGLLLRQQWRIGWAWQGATRHYSLQWLDSQNDIDGAHSRSLLFDLRQPIDGPLDLLLGAGLDNDDGIRISVSAGVEWTGTR